MYIIYYNLCTGVNHMRRVNVTEFRNSLSHYIELSSKEEIHITKNGEVVAVLSSPNTNYYQTLTKLCGCLKDDSDDEYKDMIGEEIMKRCGY